MAGVGRLKTQEEVGVMTGGSPSDVPRPRGAGMTAQDESSWAKADGDVQRMEEHDSLVPIFRGHYTAVSGTGGRDSVRGPAFCRLQISFGYSDTSLTSLTSARVILATIVH